MCQLGFGTWEFLTSVFGGKSTAFFRRKQSQHFVKAGRLEGAQGRPTIAVSKNDLKYVRAKVRAMESKNGKFMCHFLENEIVFNYNDGEFYAIEAYIDGKSYRVCDSTIFLSDGRK